MVEKKMRLTIKKALRIALVFTAVLVVYMITFGINTEIDCFQFCIGKTCFSSRLTILVYKDDVEPKDMKFLQSFRPQLGIKKYAMDSMTGQLDRETCPMEEHFPQFTTIPTQNNCAIVGNSGVLLHSNCGNEINSYDYVIRMNLAPVRDFADDVGVRTNLTLMNFESLVYLHSNLTQKEPGDKFLDMYVNRVWFLNDTVIWYAKSMAPRETRKRLQQSVEVLKKKYQLPIRFGYSWRTLHAERYVSMKRLATTGFNAYYVAKSFCKHITLYGFYPFSKDARGYHVPHHYYEDVRYEYSNPVHNFNWEFNKLQEYEKEDETLKVETGKCIGAAVRRRDEGVEKPIGDLLWFKVKP
ncbi:CMP-N-acetylneuraminate-poly-alpha-2,8-sialyltransferase-like [Asterias amurensis]|uniref:CMP-N-acetylneuraminate-poly-alpha-2, 8-sialyltransferase-like n=1 Tax=Asterias amurensis TaxID=7602 RepID=UPI003AB51DEA